MSISSGCRIAVWLAGISAALPTTPEGGSVVGDSPSTETTRSSVLSIVPADVALAFIVQDPAGVDRRAGALFPVLGVTGSPYELIKRSLGIVTGLDDHGSAAIVVLPAGGGESASAGTALVLPTTDRRELLAFLDPRPTDAGLSRVNLRGKESYAGWREGFTVFAPDRATVVKLISSQQSLVARCSDEQLEQIAKHDASLYVNKPAFDRTMAGRRIHGWLGDWYGVRSLATGVETALVSARVESDGISLRGIVQHRAASNITVSAEPVEALLAWPSSPVAVAMGGAVSADARWAGVVTESLVSYAVGAGLLRSERAGALRAAIRRLVSQSANVSLSAGILERNGQKSLGVTVVLLARIDGRAIVQAMNDLVQVLKGGLFADERYQRFMDRAVWQRAAEAAADVSIDHLTLPLNDLPGVDQQNAASFLSAAGLLARVGVVDRRHVVVTIGGGIEHFNRVVGRVRSEQTEHRVSADVQLAHQRLPADRSWETYVSMAQCRSLWCHLSAVWGPTCEPGAGTTGDRLLAVSMNPLNEKTTALGAFVPLQMFASLRGNPPTTPSANNAETPSAATSEINKW